MNFEPLYHRVQSHIVFYHLWLVLWDLKGRRGPHTSEWNLGSELTWPIVRRRFSRNSSALLLRPSRGWFILAILDTLQSIAPNFTDCHLFRAKWKMRPVSPASKSKSTKFTCQLDGLERRTELVDLIQCTKVAPGLGSSQWGLSAKCSDVRHVEAAGLIHLLGWLKLVVLVYLATFTSPKQSALGEWIIEPYELLQVSGRTELICRSFLINSRSSVNINDLEQVNNQARPMGRVSKRAQLFEVCF